MDVLLIGLSLGLIYMVYRSGRDEPLESEINGKMKFKGFKEITSKYGMRVHPVTGESKFHNGVDLKAQVGKEIYAPDEGEVLSVYNSATGGLAMIIMLKSGVTVGFAHLSEVVKKSGSFNEGELLAKTGSSGAVTGPHLHLTVKKNLEYIDPESYFDFT